MATLLAAFAMLEGPAMADLAPILAGQCSDEPDGWAMPAEEVQLWQVAMLRHLDAALAAVRDDHVVVARSEYEQFLTAWDELKRQLPQDQHRACALIGAEMQAVDDLLLGRTVEDVDIQASGNAISGLRASAVELFSLDEWAPGDTLLELPRSVTWPMAPAAD